MILILETERIFGHVTLPKGIYRITGKYTDVIEIEHTKSKEIYYISSKKIKQFKTIKT